MNIKLVLTTSLCFLFASAPLIADELENDFKKVKELVDQKAYSKALTELSWVKSKIEKLSVQRVQEFFPETLSGYTGGKFESSGALGMTSVERTYTKSDGGSIKVSLAGGSGGQNNPFAALAGFGKMAAMFPGAQTPGQETVRIAGRTAILESGEGKDAELTVFLDSGSMLKLESRDKDITGTLKSMAEGIKIAELDEYLRG